MDSVTISRHSVMLCNSPSTDPLANLSASPSETPSSDPSVSLVLFPTLMQTPSCADSIESRDKPLQLIRQTMMKNTLKMLSFKHAVHHVHDNCQIIIIIKVLLHLVCHHWM